MRPTTLLKIIHFLRNANLGRENFDFENYDGKDHSAGGKNMKSWSIGFAEKEYLKLELSGLPEDEWVSAKASIDVGGFRGEISLDICQSDMIRFYDQLKIVYRELKGQAEFSTIEEQLGFILTADNLGHIFVKGYLKDEAGSGNELNFKMNFDQTLLQHTIADLEEYLHKPQILP
jgi:hypothetical protein